MAMRSLMIALIAPIALAAVGPVAASAQDDDDARFSIERVGEDVLRLDRVTGEVRLCVKSEPTFVCRTVVEPRAAPVAEPEPAQSEVLAENEALKAENRRLRERLAMVAALVEDIETEEGDGRIDIPSIARREIDQAVEVTGYAVRRFRDMITSLTEDEDEDGQASGGEGAAR